MGSRVLLLICLAILPAVSAQISEDAIVVIDTNTHIAETDVNYICATIDWWPEDKCNYNRCPWGSSSAINLDLSHPFLNNAVKAFKTLRVRVGGSLEDQVIYEVGKLSSPCTPFTKQNGGLFGFSTGCLRMKRWDELNDFFSKTGVVLTFGINALHGRRHFQRGVWAGEWDPTNTRDFISYTLSKGYHVDSWEFGNELSGKGIGASVSAKQYGKDLIRLNTIIDQLYTTSHQKLTSLVAPGGFFDKPWFDQLLQVSGPRVVNVVSHHMYTLGPGNDPNIMSKILSPDHLNRASLLFRNISSTIQSYAPWASAWVGESGGAYNNGARGISNAFVNGFWYLDQLGMAAKYKTRVYCRQTLIGGFYGLLNKTTYLPNPDYYRYSALLWHRLMGKSVLSVNTTSSPYLRVYAHCAKERAGGVTIVLLNLSNQTTYNVDVQSENYAEVSAENKGRKNKKSFVHGLKKSVSWIGNKALDVKLSREEYQLTPENGDLRSRSVMLNGQLLQLTETGDIPSMVPVLVDTKSRLSIGPSSIKFVVYPNFISPVCK